MTATKYLARALTVTLAAGALVTSAASCGALNESGKDKEATSSSSSSAATPSTPAESLSATPASPSVSNGGESPGGNDLGAATPGAQQPPAATGGNQTPAAPGGNQSQPSPGGTGGIDSFEDIPESAKAKLDPTPLTQEELKRGQQLPQEFLSKVVSGDSTGACELMVMVAENGEIVRFDAPEVKDLCAADLQRSEAVSSMRSMSPEQLKEATDPKKFTLQDNGDGTATYMRDGQISGTKLVRLDDGNLRVMTEIS
ncbi:hypothetical protein [Dermabacter sp. HSID17554]|uniref:hypothetical protein n=1 Tax=Dermabacter sp. HSID17554 TaxID=2419511 RepID=UPI000F869F92|nr:hypothetical protein [Dermabacter sp. HSID17554]RUP86568.1 hypothetical protein D8M36_04065 [Dermabacter sp. HSID17554]